MPGRFAEFVRLMQEGNRLANEQMERLGNDGREPKSGLAQVNGNIDTASEALTATIDATATQLNDRMDKGFGVNYKYKVEKNIRPSPRYSCSSARPESSMGPGPA